MKFKWQLIIMGGFLLACSLHAKDISLKGAVEWESAYIFRGIHQADDYISLSSDMRYKSAYAGVWVMLPLDSLKGMDEVDIYGGYTLEMGPLLYADLGGIYYTYTDETEDTVEVYGGLSFEIPLSPAVYLYYDFDLERFSAEASIGRVFSLGENASVEATAQLGYVEPEALSGYAYYGARMSYVMNLGEKVSWRIGVRLYGNEDAIEPDGKKVKATLSTGFTIRF